MTGAGTRVVIAFVCGLATFAALIVVAPWQAAVVSGWIAAAAVFLAWVWLVIRKRDAPATAALARREDSSRAAADLVLVAAAVASLAAVAGTLQKAGGEHGTGEAVLTALAVTAVILSWLTVHTIYTLHYARLYYDGDADSVDFNEEEKPDYLDFAYVALTLGMTYQVSDTNITRKAFRRAALRHAVLSFVFGTVIVAVTINVVASLLNR